MFSRFLMACNNIHAVINKLKDYQCHACASWVPYQYTQRSAPAGKHLTIIALDCVYMVYYNGYSITTTYTIVLGVI